MKLEFLPAYSPDFNPIELAFSAIKYHIRRHGELIRIATENMDDLNVFIQLHDAVWSVSATDARNWFHYCGYI